MDREGGKATLCALGRWGFPSQASAEAIPGQTLECSPHPMNSMTKALYLYMCKYIYTSILMSPRGELRLGNVFLYQHRPQLPVTLSTPRQADINRHTRPDTDTEIQKETHTPRGGHRHTLTVMY